MASMRDTQEHRNQQWDSQRNLTGDESKLKLLGWKQAKENIFQNFELSLSKTLNIGNRVLTVLKFDLKLKVQES
jgi:hypothetical protein